MILLECFKHSMKFVFCFLLITFYIHTSCGYRMKIQRHKINSQYSTSYTETVINGFEFVLYLATLIFTTAFGLFISSFITIKRNKETEKGYVAFVIDKIVDLTIKAPFFGFTCILTLPSSLFAFIIWMILSKCK